MGRWMRVLTVAIWGMGLVAFGGASPLKAQQIRTVSSPKAASTGVCGVVQTRSGQVGYVMAYKSAEAMVCVDAQYWQTEAHAAAIQRYFPYFDAIVIYDKKLFHIDTPSRPFVFEITKPTGGANTGCDLRELTAGGKFCDTVTGDAFVNPYTNPQSHTIVPGFWGFVLSVHESINVFTGMLSAGWPSDWWADHRSPFPSAMDIEFMRSIAETSDGLDASVKANLLAAADAQAARFIDPKSRQYDAQVALFIDLFQRYGGYTGYTNAFRYAIAQDHLQWPSISGDTKFTGDDNYSETLSEYVIAYLELGFGVDKDLTQEFRDAGVGVKDKRVPPYEIDSSNVRAVADAHCSIRAAAGVGIKVKRQLSALQAGDFKHAVAKGGTSTSCPAECGFSDGVCHAKF